MLRSRGVLGERLALLGVMNRDRQEAQVDDVLDVGVEVGVATRNVQGLDLVEDGAQARPVVVGLVTREVDRVEVLDAVPGPVVVERVGACLLYTSPMEEYRDERNAISQARRFFLVRDHIAGGRKTNPVAQFLAFINRIDPEYMTSRQMRPIYWLRT